MILTFTLLGFAVLALIDLVPLIKKRAKVCIAVFCVIFAVALTIAVLNIQNIEVPSVMRLLGQLLKSIGINYPATK